MLIYYNRFDERQIHERYDKLFDGDIMREIPESWEERFYAMDLGDGVIDGLDFLYWFDRRPEHQEKSLKEKLEATDQFLSEYSQIGSGIVTWEDLNHMKNVPWKWGG